MRKLDLHGMQEMSTRLDAQRTIFRGVTVGLVADNRTAEFGGVNAYLMHPPCLDTKFNKRNRAMLRENRPMRDGTLLLTADRAVQRARFLSRRTMHDGQIRLHDAVVSLEETPQGKIRFLIAGEDHHPARLDVETMDDARSLFTADAGHLGVATNQFIRQRRLAPAGRGMHDHTGRFVDDKNVIVLIYRVCHTTGLMYFCLTALQRTTQNAESGIASSIPSNGPSTIPQKKKLKMTPA